MKIKYKKMNKSKSIVKFDKRLSKRYLNQFKFRLHLNEVLNEIGIYLN